MKYHNIPTLFDNQASLINGKNIGTDSVRYIQDAGQKTAGTTYIDKNTNELYVCVTTTNSVNNDSNFSKFNLKEAFNKLDSLKNKNINMIALMDYAIGSATLYLNRPYTDFSLLLIHVSNDSRGNSSFTIMPTELLKIGKTYNFGNNLDYWYAKIESLQNIGYADENCFIEMIYGININ